MSQSRSHADSSSLLLKIQNILGPTDAKSNNQNDPQGFSLNKPFLSYQIKSGGLSCKLLGYDDAGKWSSMIFPAAIYIHDKRAPIPFKQVIYINDFDKINKLKKLFESYNAKKDSTFDRMYFNPIFWDVLSVGYVYPHNTGTREHYDRLYSQYSRVLSEIVKNEKKISLIDAGCGDGKFASYLMERYWFNSIVKYLGFDYNAKNIKDTNNIEIQKNHMSFQHGDIQNLDEILINARKDNKIYSEGITIVVFSGVLTRLVLQSAFDVINPLQQAWLTNVDYLILAGVGEVLLNSYMAKRLGYELNQVNEGIVVCKKMSLDAILKNKKNKIKNRQLLDLSFSPQPFVVLEKLLEDEESRAQFSEKSITIDFSYSCINEEELDKFKKNILDHYPLMKIIYCSQEKSNVNLFIEKFGEKLIRAQHTPSGEALLFAPKNGVDTIMGPVETFKHALATEKSIARISTLLEHVESTDMTKTDESVVYNTDHFSSGRDIVYSEKIGEEDIRLMAGVNEIPEQEVDSIEVASLLEILHKKADILTKFPYKSIATAIIKESQPERALITLLEAGLDPFFENYINKGFSKNNLFYFLYEAVLANQNPNNIEHLKRCIQLLIQTLVKNSKQKKFSILQYFGNLDRHWVGLLEKGASSILNLDFLIHCAMEAGVEIDEKYDDGCNMLMRAIKHGQIALAKALIAAGASISVVDKQGNTAFTYAKNLGCKELIDLLTDPHTPPLVTQSFANFFVTPTPVYCESLVCSNAPENKRL